MLGHACSSTAAAAAGCVTILAPVYGCKTPRAAPPSRVRCLDCGAESCRHELQNRLAILNPAAADAARTAAAAAAAAGFSGREAYRRALAAGTAADARKVAAAKGAEQVLKSAPWVPHSWPFSPSPGTCNDNSVTLVTSLARPAFSSSHPADLAQVPVRRPDGDVELADAGTAFVLAPCSECGGQMLKPDVVFFGDSVPKDRTDRCAAFRMVARNACVAQLHELCRFCP